MGQEVSYLSFEDYLTFSGFWPWSQEDHLRQIVFDDDGMVSSVRPCPHSLSASQIEAMRTVADEALSAPITNRERRVLMRVKQRLAGLAGGGLASGQAGCTDLPTDDVTGRIPKEDAW